MVKIMFVCLGNICRSPMAEFVMADLIRLRGYEGKISVASSATSREEEGHGVHYGTLRKLREVGIPVYSHYATPLRASDADEYDYIVGMEERNLIAMRRILGDKGKDKIYSLLQFTDYPHDIADPWWTGDFDTTYSEISKGCEGLLAYVEAHHTL